MPGRRVIRITAIAAAALALSAYAFGGWATITVDEFPETVVAARPTTLSFVVRQHGLTLLDKGHLGELGTSHLVARQELRGLISALNLPLPTHRRAPEPETAQPA